jgi:hypothetical protein
MLTRDQIFAKREFPRHELALPELGGSVQIRVLSAGEFLKLNEKIDANKDAAFAYWICAGVVGADGQPLFTEADIDRLKELPIGVVERMTNAVQRHNFLTKEQAAGKSKGRTAA